MKKISMLFLSVMMLVLLTGCGTTKDVEKELICTTTESEEGLDIEQVISMTYKNDKLKRMKMEVNTKITDATIKENWEEFKKSMDKDNTEFTKEGMTLKVETNDQNYEYKTTLDIDLETVSDETLKDQGFDGLKDDDSTLESTKEEAEKDGANCVVK